jgi:hypothetical protein
VTSREIQWDRSRCLPVSSSLSNAGAKDDFCSFPKKVESQVAEKA